MDYIAWGGQEAFEAAMLAEKEKQQTLLRKLHKRWRHNNPEKTKNKNRKMQLRKYGITIDEYNALLKLQEGRCAICKTDMPDSRGYNFYVDHDHKTGKVRGLLCSNCNLTIGKHSKEQLLAMINYLEKHSLGD